MNYNGSMSGNNLVGANFSVSMIVLYAQINRISSNWFVYQDYVE